MVCLVTAVAGRYSRMGHCVSMAKIPCPIPGYDETGENDQPRFYVTVPDEWLGEHTEAYAAAMDAVTKSGLIKRAQYSNFAISLALADDYRLPLLEGKPENWPDDIFPKFPLQVMAWVNWLVVQDYVDCFAVKKNWSRRSQNGLKPTGTDQAPGNLEATA